MKKYYSVFIISLFFLLLGCKSSNITVNAGVDRTVISGEEVLLDGTGTTVSSGTLKYHWKQLEGSKVTLSNENSVKASFIAPEVMRSEILVFMLEVSIEGTDKTSRDSVEITVNPSPDITKPVITLNGASVIEVRQGSVYVDAGATAYDERDGILDVTIEGEVNTSILGSYTITYTATDSAGNSATAIRIVKVIPVLDTTPSDDQNITSKPPLVLETLYVLPKRLDIREGDVATFIFEGDYSDGIRRRIEEVTSVSLSNPEIATVSTNGEVEALQVGESNITFYLGTYQVEAYIMVHKPIDTDNMNAGGFGREYIDTIPIDATLERYDDIRFCMITGKVLSSDGIGLEGVKVSIFSHPEYGTVTTDENGVYVIPSEGGRALTMRYAKVGFTTVDRTIEAPVQEWVRTPDVTMLAYDDKVTTIDLNASAPQIHTSTLVSDDRGERSTTLVFKGVHSATVTAPEGSSRELTLLNVRATEFRTPKSMPGNLPVESAYTYCSDLTVDGVSDDENVTFDAPVVMYVDNFLGFDVGEIVPIGYYDRNSASWKPSDNGVVVKLLDTDNDGKVDALDSTGDDLPDDLNGNGTYDDEVSGIADNPAYAVGNTYWRAEITHFTPWDHNWPYAPPEDAEDPNDPDVDSDDDEPNDCQADISSYVTKKSRVFHEDIPITGTDITLHYSSKRVKGTQGSAGYTYIIDASLDATNAPASVSEAYVTCTVGGRLFKRKVSIGELNTLTFEWDGKDSLGRPMNGEVPVTIKVVYKYNLVYMRASSAWLQAWAKAGEENTNIIGRDKIEYSVQKRITLHVEGGALQQVYHTGNGWSFSNVHSLGRNVVYKGDGTILDKQVMLEDGLIAYYRFENDAKDSSGHQYNGIEHGNVQYKEGQIGQAAQFGNFMDLIEIPYNLFEDLQETTVSMWIKFNEPDKRAGLLSAANSSCHNEYLLFIAGGYGNQPVIKNGLINNTYNGNHCLSYGNRVDDGLFHHIISTTSKHEVKYYIDGELDTICEMNIEPFHVESSIWLGNDQDRVNGYFEETQQFKGLMDDLRIYTKVLTDKEVELLYGFGITGHISYEFDTLTISDHNLEYQFDLDGKHIATKTFPDQKLLEAFTYGSNGYVVTMTDRFGQTTTIERDGEGNPTRIIAPNGQVTELRIDSNGDLVEVKYEDGSKYAFTYFEGSLMDTMSDPNGNVITHSWDENGRIIEEVDALGGSYRFLRSMNGNETFYSTVLPEGETSTSKDVKLSNGDTQSTITLPTGERYTATFAKDESHTSVLKDGVQYDYLYSIDALTDQRYLSSMTTVQPSGLSRQTSYTRSYEGNETHTDTQTQTVISNGKTVTIVTDYNTGTVTLTTPEGRQAVTTYDVDTLLTTQERTGTLTPTIYSYDDKGRITALTTGDRSVTYSYDAHGNVASMTDALGRTTTFVYDVVDNLTQITYPDGTTEHFAYDRNGNLLIRTVPTPADHTFAYNGGDLRTSYTTPLNKATTYSYDKSKHLTNITRPSGKRIEYTYVNGRLEKITTPEGVTEYGYLFANKAGSITKPSTGSGADERIEYTYDGTLLTGIAQSGMLHQTISYSYNNDFAVTSMTYAGATQTYAYDNDGLLTQSGAYTLTRDAQNGYATQLSDGTLTQNRIYNSYGELTRLEDNLFSYTLERNKNGQIVTKTETLEGVDTTYDYSYDEMGRLIEVKKDNQIVESYSYDANGNRESATVNSTSTTGSYTLDDALTVYGDNTYRYDEDGYLIEKTAPEGSTTYTYNTLGALTKVVLPNGTTIEYPQDALNRRVAKKVNGVIVEKYLWEDLTTLLAVYDKDDNLIQRFEYADQRMPVAMMQNGQKYYLYYDQVGSLRAVSDTNGHIIKEITYDTYGNIIADSNPNFKVPFGFAGGLYDPDTKLTHFGYREYDAFTGKWTAKDPIGFAGGDSNLYGYVLNDPVNLMDPEGLRPPANVPPNADMCQNKRMAKRMSPYDFYEAVRAGGIWDYKRLNPKYEKFGNYNFGYVAAAFGLPQEFAKFGAGMYQVKQSIMNPKLDFRPDWYATYFDDPRDQRWIDEGYKDYFNDYYNCGCVAE